MKHRSLLISLLILIGIVVGCKKKDPQPANLTILFTCDTRGRLVPCGCFSGQHGGLTRLKTVLENQISTNTLRVDAGDAIRGSEDYNIIEYKYILQAYHGMNYDALNLGHREAALSAAQLKDLKKNSPVTLLSANLIEKSSGSPIFDGYKIVKRGGQNIGIIGLVDPAGLEDGLGAGLAVERMETALGNLLPEVKKKAEIIVLLAFTDEASLRRLAQEFYELDIILGGKVSQPSQTLEKVNQSLILYTANESRTLGILNTVVSGKKLVPNGHEIMLLLDKIPEDHSVQALAEKYREEVRTAKLSIDDPANLQANMVPGVKGVATYSGTANCVTCHPSAAKAWEQSGHAEAMSTLVHRKADADPNCISCHTVGFGTMSGYRREYNGKKLADVGCESCHGPGSLHVEQYQKKMQITFKFRPLAAGDCRKCHFGEFSRPFDWEKFWPEIAHGKEPVRTALREGIKK